MAVPLQVNDCLGGVAYVLSLPECPLRVLSVFPKQLPGGLGIGLKSTADPIHQVSFGRWDQDARCPRGLEVPRLPLLGTLGWLS